MSFQEETQTHVRGRTPCEGGSTSREARGSLAAPELGERRGTPPLSELPELPEGSSSADIWNLDLSPELRENQCFYFKTPSFGHFFTATLRHLQQQKEGAVSFCLHERRWDKARPEVLRIRRGTVSYRGGARGLGRCCGRTGGLVTDGVPEPTSPEVRTSLPTPPVPAHGKPDQVRGQMACFPLRFLMVNETTHLGLKSGENL